MVWCGVVWCRVSCHGMVWFGMVWYGISHHITSHHITSYYITYTSTWASRWVGLLLLTHGGNKSNSKIIYQCIYLTILFQYRNLQYAIIMSSESSMSTSLLQTCIDGQWFSKVIQLRTVLRPVYVVLGIKNDPEGEFNAWFIQYLHSVYRSTRLIW